MRFDVGIPNLSVEGTTEAEAIANVKAAILSQFKTGKWVTIEVDKASLALIQSHTAVGAAFKRSPL